MLSISSPSTSARFYSSLKLLHRNPNPRFPNLRPYSASAPNPQPPNPQPVRGNYAGVRLEESVDVVGSGKTRLDTWISSRNRGVSRARIQSSIRSGLVSVNSRTINKVSHIIKVGDKISCTVSELQPLRAEPEDIPLDIVYEDDHVLVVNKPAHMVIHPAPGNTNGTLVNAVLHHCSLPTVACINNERTYDDEDFIESSDTEIEDLYIDQSNNESLVRPGIVHRLDKGTSGLLIVAKDEHSHSHLAEQFKQHTIHRVYISLTTGVPSPSSGRVEVPIARDSNNRIRVAALPGLNNSRHARYAASRYKVVETFAGGGSVLVQWRLETGCTHQIRAHAKYLGVPLLGDELYGGTKNMALSLLKPRIHLNNHSQLSHIMSRLERPCLHALSLGFEHPRTGGRMKYSCLPPDDFSGLLGLLRSVSCQSAFSN